MFQSRGSTGIVDRPLSQRAKQEVRTRRACSFGRLARQPALGAAQESCLQWTGLPVGCSSPLCSGLSALLPPAIRRPSPTRSPQINLSSFAYLFSEIVQYCQSRVSNIGELERK